MARFIAYFDVMGFKDFAYRNSHQDLVKLLRSLSVSVSAFDSVNTQKRQQHMLGGITSLLDPPADDFSKSVLFSDTVLFFTDSDSDNDLEQILKTAHVFLGTALQDMIPIKGALAHGEFEVDRQNSIYCGRPLIDAYELAEEAYCYAAILHHTIEAKLNHSPMVSKVVFGGKVPFKSGSITHKYINPSLDDDFQESIRDLYLGASGRIRRYVDNTLELYSNHLQLIHQTDMEMPPK
jgi:hypothetical protein